MKLNQLRFGRGKCSGTSDARLKQLGQDALLLEPDDDNGHAHLIDRGLRITVDLQGNGSEVVAYKANRFSPPIDLSKIDYYDAADFWSPILRNEKLQYVLEPGEFYILASKQRIRIPSDLAAEMLPYDLATQEFRVHYAGFFDPGFGYGRDGEIPGTRAVLEVRASQIPILLEDDQFVGRLNYYNMSAKPNKVYGGPIGSSYQQQGLALSKQFKPEQRFVSGSGSNPRAVTADSAGPEPDSDAEDDRAAFKLSFPVGTFAEGLSAKSRQG
jgi:dCTP deaminase